MEDETDAGTTGDLLGVDAFRVTLDLLAVVAGELGEDLEEGGRLVLQGLAQSVPLPHKLGQPGGYVVFELREARPYVPHQELVQRPRQVRRPISGRKGGVLVLEELLLLPQSLLDRLPLRDVLLATVHDSDDAQLDRDHLSLEEVLGIGAGVHEIQFSAHHQGAVAFWVDLPGQLEGLGGGEVGVGGVDGQYDALGVLDELQRHVVRLGLYVLRLVPHWDAGDSRKVYQRQVEDMRRVDGQRDGCVADALVRSRQLVGLAGDLVPDFGEVLEHLAIAVKELSPSPKWARFVGFNVH